MSKQHGGVVVVGVDGSATSVGALRYALEEGLRRGVGVEVVTAWVWNPPAGEADAPATLEAAKAAAQAMQDRVVRHVLAETDPTPPVSQTVAHGYGAEVLREACRHASVLVVGHTPRGFLARTVLGSVSEACIRHADIPVIVVPTHADLSDDDHEELAGPVRVGG